MKYFVTVLSESLAEKFHALDTSSCMKISKVKKVVDVARVTLF